MLTAFTKPIPAPNSSFGIAVAALGTDRVIIGANSEDVGGVIAGAAYF